MSSVGEPDFCGYGEGAKPWQISPVLPAQLFILLLRLYSLTAFYISVLAFPPSQPSLAVNTLIYLNAPLLQHRPPQLTWRKVLLVPGASESQLYSVSPPTHLSHGVFFLQGLQTAKSSLLSARTRLKHQGCERLARAQVGQVMFTALQTHC